MYDPAWKRLVEDLRATGFRSVYADRLAERLPENVAAYEQGLGGVQREIVEEMAYALLKAEDKVNLAMLRCELAGRAIDDASEDADLTALYDEYGTLRRAALQARWEYKVHREALGMVRHAILEELFPLPPVRRPP